MATPDRSSQLSARTGITLLLIIAGVCVVSGIAIANEIASKNFVVPIAFLGYLVLLLGTWWLTKGNLLILVLVAYLLGPAPADNLLPQVAIFPDSDFSVRPRDLFLLADLVLLVALWLTQPWGKITLRKHDPMTWWLVGLALLALYPAVLGVWFGSGQSGAALLQGALMPLRAIGLACLVGALVAVRGWSAVIRDVVSTAVICGAVLAAGVLLAVVGAHGQTQFSAFSYPLIVDSRPALPGWGNNILANFLATCVAITVCCRRYLPWRTRYVAGLVALLIVGIEFTEARSAMVLALLIALTPVVVATVRTVRSRKGIAFAAGAGALTALALTLITVVALPVVNPRFTTFTPSAITEKLPAPTDTEDPHRPTYSSATETDLGAESAATRTKLAKAAGKLWLRNPVFGIGWNGWGWGKSELPAMLPEPKVPLVVGLDPHSGLLWLLAETGVLGVALLYGPVVWSGMRNPRAWWLWVPIAVATGLELVNPNLRNGHFAALVWVFIALAMLRPINGLVKD